MRLLQQIWDFAQVKNIDISKVDWIKQNQIYDFDFRLIDKLNALKKSVGSWRMENE